jgi:hypothetical protein
LTKRDNKGQKGEEGEEEGEGQKKKWKKQHFCQWYEFLTLHNSHDTHTRGLIF